MTKAEKETKKKTSKKEGVKKPRKVKATSCGALKGGKPRSPLKECMKENQIRLYGIYAVKTKKLQEENEKRKAIKKKPLLTRTKKSAAAKSSTK
jgi:hypothetical protein